MGEKEKTQTQSNNSDNLRKTIEFLSHTLIKKLHGKMASIRTMHEDLLSSGLADLKSCDSSENSVAAELVLSLTSSTTSLGAYRTEPEVKI